MKLILREEMDVAIRKQVIEWLKDLLERNEPGAREISSKLFENIRIFQTDEISEVALELLTLTLVTTDDSDVAGQSLKEAAERAKKERERLLRVFGSTVSSRSGSSVKYLAV